MNTIKILVLSIGLITISVQADDKALLKDYLEKDNYPAAEQVAKKLLKAEPRNQEYQLNLAQIYLNTRQYDDAEEYIEKVLEHEELDESHWLLASLIYGMQAQESSIFSKLGYAKKAKASLESLLKLNPNSEDGLLGLIQFHMAAPGIAGGDEDEIPQLMARLKPINPVRYTLMKSQSQFAEENIAEGFSILEKGLKEFPESVELLFVKAIQLNQQNKHQAAFDTFNGIQQIQLKEEASNQEKSWHEMSVYQAAKVSAEHGVSLEQGKKNMFAFMESAQDQVEESWIRFRLGQILWQLEEKDFALAQFELIPSLKPDDRLQDLLESFSKKHRIKL